MCSGRAMPSPGGYRAGAYFARKGVESGEGSAPASRRAESGSTSLGVDAFVLADQARIRRDLGLLRPGDEIAIDLRTLTTRRLDLVFDRTRRINRLRSQVLETFPVLGRSLDLTNQGPMMLLTGYQAPAVVRRTGMKHAETSLKNRKVKVAAALARTVVEAAQAQQLRCPVRSWPPPWWSISPRR